MRNFGRDIFGACILVVVLACLAIRGLYALITMGVN